MRRPVRTPRGNPSRERSPTPNNPQNDPFRVQMSPETARQKMLQEKRTRNMENAATRAKAYAERFQNFINNTSVNHLQTNDENFRRKLNNVTNPTYLLSDALNNKNGKVRHVYSREYLNKVFKNKTIHRGPHTGVPTHPSMMRPFQANVNKINNARFQLEKQLLIDVYGKKRYYETPLQTKHIVGEVQEYHLNLALFIVKFFKKYDVFLHKFLLIPESVTAESKKLYELTRRDIVKIFDIIKTMKERYEKIKELPVIRVVFTDRIIQILYDVPRHSTIQKIINTHRNALNEFKNVLNF